MSYYRVLGYVASSPDFCFVGKGPVGMPAARRDDPRLGIELGSVYPSDELAVGLPIDESAGGLALPDCVANTQCLLLVSRSCADYMTGAFQLGKCEVLPVHLINEKQRVHARDYAMMNPIGAIDCLDRSRSELRMSSDGEVLAVKEYVLNEGKIPRGLDLFRVKDDVFQYFFSQRLVDSLGAEGYSNFVFEPVPVAGSGV